MKRSLSETQPNIDGQKAAIRRAVPADINLLVEVEKRCFDSDRLSRRSFNHFIREGAHELLVLEHRQQLVAYVLLLYRRGTNLARLYSIAVDPAWQGHGFSKVLLEAAEQAAQSRTCAFIRLEVSEQNQLAMGLYSRFGYKSFGRIRHYYQDGSDALRMEKKLHYAASRSRAGQPYYQQTTEFTCGPASLMMAMKSVDKSYQMTRREELQIWRESTTIFMTSGHGGCSPHGLALSAWQRGMSVKLYINQSEPPFIESVRDLHKRQVIQLVHDDFCDRLAETDVNVEVLSLEADALEKVFAEQDAVVALISTWRLNRNKAPHWVYIAGSDEEFVYMNDPDLADDPHLTQTDFMQVPVSWNVFREMARFGKQRLRSFLVISKR